MGNTISTLSSCCIRADSSSEGTEECNLSLGSCLSAGMLGDFSDQDFSDRDSGFELRGWLRCGGCHRVDLDLCSGTAATWPPRRLLSGTWTSSPSSSASRSPADREEIVDTAPLFGRSPSPPLNLHGLGHFHPYMSQMIPTMSFIIITHDQKIFSKNWSKFFSPRVPPLHEKVNTVNIYFYHWSSCSAIISFFHVL